MEPSDEVNIPTPVLPQTGSMHDRLGKGRVEPSDEVNIPTPVLPQTGSMHDRLSIGKGRVEPSDEVESLAFLNIIIFCCKICKGRLGSYGSTQKQCFTSFINHTCSLFERRYL